MGSPAGAGFSIAGAGLGAISSVVQAKGVQQGDIFKAEMLEQNAKRGEVAAVQTGADYTRKLSVDLGNIDILRAAAHTDPTSATGAAIRDTHEQFGLTQKSIAVDNIMAQARQQESEASYLRSAGKSALLSGYIGAGAGLFGAVDAAVEAFATTVAFPPHPGKKLLERLLRLYARHSRHQLISQHRCVEMVARRALLSSAGLR